MKEHLEAELAKIEAHRREAAKKERRRRLFRNSVSVAGGVVAWHIMSHTIMIHVPDPIETVIGTFWAVQQTYFYKSIIYSVYRVFTGYIIGCMIGIPLGLLMGWNKIITDFHTDFETLI